MVLPSSVHGPQSSQSSPFQYDGGGEIESTQRIGLEGSYMPFIHDFLLGQNSVTRCPLMQRRLGNVVQLCGQEEEMGLVNILPVSTPVSYCTGLKFCLRNISKSFLFFSISNITSFVFHPFPVSYNTSFFLTLTSYPYNFL